MKEYTIDVKNKPLGRAASEVAAILRGKSELDFAANRVPDVKVNIINLDDIKLTGKKMKQKEYKNYSGYPGGLRFTSIENTIEKKGKEFVFRNAVMGMLPKNRLRSIIIQNLIIKKESEVK